MLHVQSFNTYFDFFKSKKQQTMKNLLIAIALLAIVSCKKEDVSQTLCADCQEVYGMVLGKHFNYPPEVNFIEIGDKISFYDVPIAETASFKVEAMEDYFALPTETPGTGVLFIGEGYKAKVYKKDGTVNYIFAYVYKGDEMRMSMIVKP
jgi:hypothetical protein